MVFRESQILANTESFCPVCLKRVPAKVVTAYGTVYLLKNCNGHGSWQVPLWRGEPDFVQWHMPKTSSHSEGRYADRKTGRPFDYGLCEEHLREHSSVLLEVTQHCNLSCRVCYADVGKAGRRHEDPDLATIGTYYDGVLLEAGTCNIQLSGGEPTLRNDLAEIIALGRSKGFSSLQLNTNGLRLAEEPGYAHSLAKAGLTTVFLQFDGTHQQIYRELRGRQLLEEKAAAVEQSAAAGLGVVLVPTLVPGVNTHDIGNIINFAMNRLNAVRGVHFQPASYIGRYSMGKHRFQRFTLPEVMRAIEEQTDGLMKVSDFAPAGGGKAQCSFSRKYRMTSEGWVCQQTSSTTNCCCSQNGQDGLQRTIVPEIPQRVVSPGQASAAGRMPATDADMELVVPPDQARNDSLTISCTVFQDLWNLDLERLSGCCTSTMSPGGKLIPFCAYNLTTATGDTPYRD